MPTMKDPGDPRVSPREGAESEEQEIVERSAVERGTDRGARSEADDPREEEGWSQPESSAQKNAEPDLG